MPFPGMHIRGEGDLAPTDTKLELLRRVPLFSGCKTTALQEIEKLADEIDVQDGYVLIREGTFGEQFFLIVDGHVRIERDGQTVRTLGPGEFVGEISLIDKGRTSATATTDGPAKLFVLAHREFNSLLDRAPGIRVEIMTAMASRLRQLDPPTA
jgi:CRP/FNR family transcriptional regulator, cyclic AMP receptor protein